MSSYISQDNQRLLWNTILNVPLFMNIFDGQSTNPDMLTDMTLKRGMISQKKLDMEAGMIWFQNIVKNFYDNNINLPSNHLQQLNKATISFMINDLKTMSKPQINEPPPTFYESQTIVNEKKLDMDLVQKRQQEYENMFKKTLPPEVDFREKISDKTDGKIDDLLQQHIQKREHELKQYAPPILPPDQSMVQTREAVKKIPPLPEFVGSATQEQAAPVNDVQNILQLLKPIETREPRETEKVASKEDIVSMVNILNRMAESLDSLKDMMQRNFEKDVAVKQELNDSKPPPKNEEEDVEDEEDLECDTD